MGKEATQPWNITYSVLGPSIDFGGEGLGEGQPCTQCCSLDLSLKPSLKKNTRENQSTAAANKHAALLKVSTSPQAACPTSSLTAVCVILIYRNALEAGTCQSEL